MVDELKESADKKPRRESIRGIIIHHTGLPKIETPSFFDSIKNWLTKKDDAYVSAHFLIGRNGRCAQLVDPDSWISFHAGKSAYWHPAHRKVMPSLNEWTVGIELIGDGNVNAFTDAQYDKLSRLCAALMQKYPAISPLCITGHENVAVPDGRKNDPGKLFNWQHFYMLLYKRYSEPSVVVSNTPIILD